MKIADNKNGSITVEASLVVPIVIFCIFAVMYFAILLYQQVHLQATADLTSEKGAESWYNSKINIETGKLDMKYLDNDGLYWQLLDLNKDKKLNKINNFVLAGKNKGLGMLDMSSILVSRMENRNQRVNVVIKDFVIYKKLEVSIRDRYGIPAANILQVFGKGDSLNIPEASEYVISQPSEFIRNIDFVDDLGKEIGRKYPGIGSTFQKIADTIGNIKGKISEFFN
ncbi:MAG: pilus assembly protein [Bacillota bacterium]|nr:pilus assembly protein [Bacillota bacterium]